MYFLLEHTCVFLLHCGAHLYIFLTSSLPRGPKVHVTAVYQKKPEKISRKPLKNKKNGQTQKYYRAKIRMYLKIIIDKNPGWGAPVRDTWWR